MANSLDKGAFVPRLATEGGVVPLSLSTEGEESQLEESRLEKSHRTRRVQLRKSHH